MADWYGSHEGFACMTCREGGRRSIPRPNDGNTIRRARASNRQLRGVVERTAKAGGHVANFGEGPPNGKPLVLLHGQGSQWEDYVRVLPTLIRNHHVYAIDAYGHGQSSRLPPRSYTNAQIGTLLAEFLETVVGERAIVSGHSSGALLALWLAANRPDLVRGLVLEDPPLFSSIPPRAETTTGAVLPRLAAEYLREHPDTSFQRYYVEKSNYFAFFGLLAPWIVRYSLRWVDRHPAAPLRIFFLPPLVNVYFQGLVHYDPAFGAAWDDGTWHDGFDTATALASVDVPTTLIHTTWWFDKHGTYYSDDGVLMAAMDREDTARAAELLGDPKIVTIRSGHLVHFERPNRLPEGRRRAICAHRLTLGCPVRARSDLTGEVVEECCTATCFGSRLRALRSRLLSSGSQVLGRLFRALLDELAAVGAYMFGPYL
jgi:pimeloyl-ACP methyl ester carboxylesterase